MADWLGLGAGWAVLGWLVGALAARGVRLLLEPDIPDLPEPPHVRPLGPLAADLPLQALLALAFGALALARGPALALPIQSLYAVALVMVLVIDARTRYVYNLVAYPAVIAGVVLTPLVPGGPLWSGLAGALLAGGILVAFRWVGERLFGIEAIASGDITIAAMVGAMVGFSNSLLALFYGAAMGGVFALAVGVFAARGSIDRRAVGLSLGLGCGVGLVLYGLALLPLLGGRMDPLYLVVVFPAGLLLGLIVSRVATRSRAISGGIERATLPIVVFGALLGGVSGLVLGIILASGGAGPREIVLAWLVGGASGALIGVGSAVMLRLGGMTMAYGPGLCLGALLFLITVR